MLVYSGWLLGLAYTLEWSVCYGFYASPSLSSGARIGPPGWIRPPRVEDGPEIAGRMQVAGGRLQSGGPEGPGGHRQGPGGRQSGGRAGRMAPACGYMPPGGPLAAGARRNRSGWLRACAAGMPPRRWLEGPGRVWLHAPPGEAPIGWASCAALCPWSGRIGEMELGGLKLDLV